LSALRSQLCDDVTLYENTAEQVGRANGYGASFFGDDPGAIGSPLTLAKEQNG